VDCFIPSKVIRRCTSKIERKSPIFPPPVYLTPPMKGLPLEFCIGVRGPECFYDVAIRWSKKFSDTFSHFETIPAVTDSHPAIHVAVAITLNAKASSLKTESSCRLDTPSHSAWSELSGGNAWAPRPGPHGEGSGRGGEVKGKGHSPSPLSMRIDLEKNFKPGTL